MQTEYTLMTPGPVPVPPEVLQALARPMEHHRTPEFEKVFARVLIGLKEIFQTKQTVFVHTSTGSGAMESAIVNTFSPGEKVVCVVSGKFGERWAEMCEVYGLQVVRLNVEWGSAVDPNEIETCLKNHPDACAVLTQTCETSTGVLHPIAEIARLTRTRNVLLMVDAITAMGALPLPMDEWGLDVVIAGSQKAFMLPTGISFIAFSVRAWKKVETAKLPRYYFDVRREAKALLSGESYFSTAVMHIHALDAVLNLMQAQGLVGIQNRIRKLSDATRAACAELGLEVFAKSVSPSLTAIRLPGDVDGQALRSELEKTYRIVVMGGQDKLKGKIIRVGHMGYILDQDLLRFIQSLALVLNKYKPGFISEVQLAKAVDIASEKLRSLCSCAQPCIGCRMSTRK